LSTFLLEDEPKTIAVKGHKLIDVAYWAVGEQILISVVNVDYADTRATIRVVLPLAVTGIVSQPWGSLEWTLADNTMEVDDLAALSTSMVILRVAKSELRVQAK